MTDDEQDRLDRLAHANATSPEAYTIRITSTTEDAPVEDKTEQ